MIRLGILTVSTLGAQGRRQDGSGDAIAAWAGGHGYPVERRELVPDETGVIARRLAEWADERGVDLVLTTGGTGLASGDRTPEATRAVIEREAQGITEYLRAMSWPTFPRAALSRGVAGVRGSTLIVNLPGSVTGVKEHLAALDHLVEHAVELLRGETEH